MEKKNSRFWFYLLCFIGLTMVVVTYLNHFDNDFHFDDSHTVQSNPYIRNINNIPLFFKDGTTFSVLPSNQSYRPLVSTTLAIDYYFGGGLKPFYFHISMFFLFLLQGVLMYLFINKAGERAGLVFHEWFSLFATFWYLLHPAIAETVNYVIARSDLMSTFFVVVAFVMYQYSGFSRKYFLYLIPVFIGSLAKTPAVMFAPMLLVYIWLIEENGQNWVEGIRSAFIKSWPSFLVAGLSFAFVQSMEPDTWTPGGSSRFHYLITQPFVIIHYFSTFFLPLELTADTDLGTFSSIYDPRAWIGFLFVGILILILLKFSFDKEFSIPAFGLWWFFLALAPVSSIIPLAEVLNDHRLYFPYIGLAISVSWFIFQGINKMRRYFQGDSDWSKSIVLILFVMLSAYAYGTYQRNIVWDSEKSLWKDVALKSPRNARGLMNYGLALMGEGNKKDAEIYFTKAMELWPGYSYLYINMGALKKSEGKMEEAERYFLKAIELAPGQPSTYLFAGGFYFSNGEYAKAERYYLKCLEISPSQTEAGFRLLEIYEKTNQHHKIRSLAEMMLEIMPEDARLKAYSLLGSADENRIPDASTADEYLQLSLMYYNAGRYELCVEASKKAIELKPEFPEAYNNICVAYNQLGEGEKALEACEKSLSLQPNNELTRNNLNWAKKIIAEHDKEK